MSDTLDNPQYVQPEDILTVDNMELDSTERAAAAALIEGYGLLDDIGDRTLIVPDPLERAPSFPFGALTAVVDQGWADNESIAKVLDKARHRDAIFVQGQSPPVLVLTNDRYKNIGYGYEGETDLLTTIHNKRTSWYVRAGSGHPDNRRTLSKHDTYGQAVAAALTEARQYMPKVFSQSRIVMSSGIDIETFDWSSWQDHPATRPDR